jgi:hypothetical protein
LTSSISVGAAGRTIIAYAPDEEMHGSLPALPGRPKKMQPVIASLLLAKQSLSFPRRRTRLLRGA